jgi:hypothetical protein
MPIGAKNIAKTPAKTLWREGGMADGLFFRDSNRFFLFPTLLTFVDNAGPASLFPSFHRLIY